MKQRLIDKNGDIVFGRGLGSYVDNNNSIMLDVITRIKSVSGDCFYDLTAHIDWDSFIGSKDFSKERLDADIQRVVLETDNVLSIYEFQSFLKGRVYYATITFITEDNTPLTIEINTEDLI